MTRSQLDALAPDQKRVAVAESRGWTDVRHHDVELIGVSPVAKDFRITPDYPNNRSAIVEAIIAQFVTQKQITEFGYNLLNVLRKDHGIKRLGAAMPPFLCATATALQLTDAYLLSLP